jgi:protein-disulfide isomerase
MENRDVNLERWMENRLAALQEPAGWQPDSGRAFSAMRKLDGTMKRRRRKRILLMAASMAAGLAVLLLEAPKAYCAGSGCAAPKIDHTLAITPPVQPAPAAEPRPGAQQAPAAAKPAPHPKPRPAANLNFKESGADDAPITCEIYSDYECPACAAAFQNIVPLLVADYVKTGKVRLLHRDFPLPMHPYARLAARYANAAGRAGEYEAAVAQIFRTQPAWNQTGDIDAQLMQALPPGAMQKIRQLVNEDPTLDDTVNTDVAMARQDEITSTPTLVIVVNGNREKIAPVPSYELLKSYLDRLLAPVR